MNNLFNKEGSEIINTNGKHIMKVIFESEEEKAKLLAEANESSTAGLAGMYRTSLALGVVAADMAEPAEEDEPENFDVDTPLDEESDADVAAKVEDDEVNG